MVTTNLVLKFVIKFIVKCVCTARLHIVFREILLPVLTAAMGEEAVKGCVTSDSFSRA